MKRHQATRDRRNVGEVVFLNEKIMAARELSSCCVGVEAALETNRGFGGLGARLRGVFGKANEQK